MKTRIIEIVDSRNNSKYIPQYKILFWWFRFEDARGLHFEFESLDLAKVWLKYQASRPKVIIHEN